MMMIFFKYILVFLTFCEFATGQIILPQMPENIKILRAIKNTDMVISDQSSSIEILPLLRAKPLTRDNFKLADSDAYGKFSKDALGVAFNHTSGNDLILTGEISFKLRSGLSLASISNVPTAAIKILIKPDVYIVTSSTPIELVSYFKILAISNAVEWIELYKINGKFN
jgi:hypothetical protein